MQKTLDKLLNVGDERLCVGVLKLIYKKFPEPRQYEMLSKLCLAIASIDNTYSFLTKCFWYNTYIINSFVGVQENTFSTALRKELKDYIGAGNRDNLKRALEVQTFLVDLKERMNQFLIEGDTLFLSEFSKFFLAE